MRRALVLSSCLALSACTGDSALEQFCFNHPGLCDETDAGVRDAGVLDAGAMDAGVRDAGVSDAGVDAGAPDAGPGDAGISDAGVDAGLPDAGLDDAGVSDAGESDAGVDAGLDDAGVDAGFDAGAVDAGPFDAGNPDAWVSVSAGLEGAMVRAFAIDPLDAQHVLIATQGGLWVTTNGGATWAGLPETGAEDFFSVAFSSRNPTLVFAVSMKPAATGSSTAQLFVSTDSGANFTVRSQTLSASGMPVAFSIDDLNEGHLALVFSQGAIYETFDGGGLSALSMTANQASDAVFAPNGELWVMTMDGLVRVTRGAVVPLESPGTYLTGFSPASYLARRGDGGWPLVMRQNLPNGVGGLWAVTGQLADGGPTWSQRAFRSGAVGHFAVSPTGVVAMASQYDVATSPDLGATWDFYNPLPRRNIDGITDAVAFLPDGGVWASSAGERATGAPLFGEGPWLLSGFLWQLRTAGLLANSPSQVLASPTDPLTAWAIARHGDGSSRASLYVTHDGGTWSYVQTRNGSVRFPPAALAVDPFDAQHLWLLDTSNVVWVSTNGGQTFTQATEPAALRVQFDPVHSGVTAVQENRTTSPGVLVERNAMTLAHLPVVGNAVLAMAFPRDGGLEGDLVVSTATGLVASVDGGLGVRTVSFSNPQCVELLAATPASLIGVTSAGVVNRSVNGGAGWVADNGVTNARNLALDADGTSVWASVKGSGVRFSPQAGRWENRSNGLPFDGGVDVSSFSQCASAPDVLWAAPLRRGVWRTESGGH